MEKQIYNVVKNIIARTLIGKKQNTRYSDKECTSVSFQLLLVILV